ncbi:phytoene desaturase family protein [Cryobacterium psychrophilum]|uniref:NAD(P)/FAD-dependent oxidoreductase n=1 Tax=Cryobacterium psychrophilum TaxID=41988 RepID=A0A4Y8KK09_9MICO|nr:NAD(P)/FAD-dependent oxidoreductase [Cryobacterium psychrophilum]TDW30707.1 phytoene dehydrogenase-like protein [Cryobacterium psychrophilum]TFD76610.1 NAD(P)/FAD-dependent oxidoreductase [Cryobacterium psychrophilum]
MSEVDAIVVGSGPNGLAAAVTLARAGLSVRVYEKNSIPGGGASTAELTLPGFHHDIGSAVHPMALASEFFQRFGITDRVKMLVPDISYGHPLAGGRAGIAYRDLERTAATLGPVDGRAWLDLFRPLLRDVDAVAEFTGNQLLRVPRHPLTVTRFGLRVLEQGTGAWNLRFRHDAAPALLTGAFAHAIQKLPSLSTAGAGLILALHGHARGWPIPVGGSGTIVGALVDDLIAHGGEIVTDTFVRRLADLPPAKIVLLDVAPRALAQMADLPPAYARQLARFSYGNAVAKVDYALSGPVPWSAPELRDAPTLHVGGTRAEIARAENTVSRGRHAAEPYVLVSQPSVMDSTRAPAGQHVLWAYTHVPRGSTEDQTESITRQIERFAPGFRDTILASASRTAVDLENHNPNYVGGDIAAGSVSIGQLIARPVLSTDPWRTPLPGVYLCSSSTPPGPGVHGLAGYRAALSALHHEYGIRQPPSLAPTDGPAASTP